MTPRRTSLPRRCVQLAATLTVGVGGLGAGAYGLGRLGLAVLGAATRALVSAAVIFDTPSNHSTN